MTNSVARVYLLDAPYHIDKLYDYYIPDDMAETVVIGSFVAVPFGGGNMKKTAVVAELTSASDYARLKPILSPICGSIVLDSEIIGMCLYMKEHFLCTVGDAVKAVIPSAAFTKIKEYYKVTDKKPSEGDLTANEKEIYNFLLKCGRQSANDIGLYLNIQSSVSLRLHKLCQKGYLTREAEFTESRMATVEHVSLTDEYSGKTEEELTASVRGEKQKDALRALYVTGEKTMSELRDVYEVSRVTVKSLEKLGIVTVEKSGVYRDPYRHKKIRDVADTTELSDEQGDARDRILELCRSGKPGAALLYGVTGSGKTSVIRAVTDEVLALGKQVIILVPEIALTPQTLDIFRAAYGEKVAVVHSGLSKGERWDAWRRMSSGEADVCIGTRSAVFAPMKNIGLIVIDEEQEHTYKSDMDPKYHARDIARYRCSKHGATMLLASATPSIESYRKAVEGKYRLVTLKNRYGGAVLPETVISDRRIDAKNGNMSAIGSELQVYLARVLEKNEQAILFINQRGYNKFLSCPLCGNVLTCNNCSVSYTYHTVRNADRGYLYCHYCGEKEPVPSKCPQCGNEVLKHVGYGTQLVEEELNRLFPEAEIMRMDADTMTAKFAYDELLGRFRDGEADILIGTQMVTKGHDFPNVTLVGVINADSSLYMNDYKANERAFDLITQVIGRAGRAKRKGCALIQTYNPEHPLLRTAAEQDYVKMYTEETALRKSLVFPPFCDMVLFTLSSAEESELMAASVKFSEVFGRISGGEYSDVPTVTFGPMEAPVYKVNGIYRIRFIIKCKLSQRTRSMISEVYKEISGCISKRVGISADVNPVSL